MWCCNPGACCTRRSKGEKVFVNHNYRKKILVWAYVRSCNAECLREHYCCLKKCYQKIKNEEDLNMNEEEMNKIFCNRILNDVLPKK